MGRRVSADEPAAAQRQRGLAVSCLPLDNGLGMAQRDGGGTFRGSSTARGIGGVGDGTQRRTQHVLYVAYGSRIPLVFAKAPRIQPIECRREPLGRPLVDVTNEVEHHRIRLCAQRGDCLDNMPLVFVDVDRGNVE